MCAFDIIVLVCLIPGIIEGLKKGFAREAAGVAALIAAVWISFHFSEPVCEWLSQYLGNIPPTALHVCGYAVILLVVLVLFTLLGKILKGILKFAMLGWLDAILGLLFGILKTALLIGILLLIFEPLNAQFWFFSDEELSASRLYAPLRDAAYAIFPYLKALLFKE